MANKKISGIFIKSKRNMRYYRCLHPTKKEQEEFIDKFSGASLLQDLGLDADVEMPDYLQDTKLLCYRDIRDDLRAQSQAEETEVLYEDVFYSNWKTQARMPPAARLI